MRDLLFYCLGLFTIPGISVLFLLAYLFVVARRAVHADTLKRKTALYPLAKPGKSFSDGVRLQ